MFIFQTFKISSLSIPENYFSEPIKDILKSSKIPTLYEEVLDEEFENAKNSNVRVSAFNDKTETIVNQDEVLRYLFHNIEA